MFYTINKAALVGFYAAVAASFFVTLPLLSPEVVHWMRVITLVLLGAHALEVAVFRRQIGLYKGPMAVSVCLTLLFGFLHWKPLADARG